MLKKRIIFSAFALIPIFLACSNEEKPSNRINFVLDDQVIVMYDEIYYTETSSSIIIHGANLNLGIEITLTLSTPVEVGESKPISTYLKYGLEELESYPSSMSMLVREYSNSYIEGLFGGKVKNKETNQEYQLVDGFFWISNKQ